MMPKKKKEKIKHFLGCIPAFLNDREIGSLDPDSHFVALRNGVFRLTEIGPASSADAPVG